VPVLKVYKLFSIVGFGSYRPWPTSPCYCTCRLWCGRWQRIRVFCSVRISGWDELRAADWNWERQVCAKCLSSYQACLLACLLAYSMKQSPSSEANRFSATQEIPRNLWNPKVHYRIHKSPPPFPILISSIHSILPHPTSWRYSVILSPHLCLDLPSGSFPQVSPLYRPTWY